MAWKDNISVEFFPPNTPAGMGKMLAAAQALRCLEPAFFSVTYGAGGSTQDRTADAVEALGALGFPVAPHLSCIGATEDHVRDMLKRFRQNGIRSIVALRGDLPSGTMDFGDFLYGKELVEFIRQEHQDWFNIKVAAYPEIHPRALSYDQDVKHFCEKMQAGADEAITQYLYNADAYLFFVEACQKQGITAPIIPGIMPIMNADRLVQFSDACGTDIPRWLRLKLSSMRYDSQDDLIEFGCDVVSSLCEKLIAAGAPGIHFYSMNQSMPILGICKRLGLSVDA